MVQIEAIGALIAKMLHLKTQGKQPELEAVFLDCLIAGGLDPEKIRTVPPAEALQGITDQRMLLQLLEALNVYTSTHPDPPIELLKNELKKRIVRDKIFIAG